MSIESQIVNENGLAADVRRGDFNGRPAGTITFSEPIYNWRQRSLLFFDSDGSREMNVDGGFSGTPVNIHDGGDNAGWTGVATVGTWDFASTTITPQAGTNSIEALNMSNGDMATISKGSDLDFSGYVALSGYIYLTRFNTTQQEILASFYDNASVVGNTVNLINYVDGGLLNTWQKFSIPKADLGVADVNVDELVIEVVVNAGSKPRFYLDVVQAEETGGKQFMATPARGELFQYNSIEFYFSDALDTTLLNSSMPNLSHDKILGLSSLTTGIGLQRFTAGVGQINVLMKNIGDMLSLTFDIVNTGSDGTNSFIKLRAKQPVWVTLSSLDSDMVALNIVDDLSGLTDFKAILVGRELIPHSEDD